MAFKLNLAKVKERAEEAERQDDRKASYGAQKRQTTWYNFKRGTQTLRILPPGPDENTCYIPGGDIAFPVYTHYFPNKKKCRCVAKTWPDRNEECLVCTAIREVRAWARSTGLTPDEQLRLFNGIYVKGRAFTNCIDRKETTTQQVLVDGKEVTIPVVYALGLPMTVFNRISVAIKNGVQGDITDELNGVDIMFTVSGSGMGTNYVADFLPPSKLHEGPVVRDAIIKNMYAINEIFSYPSKQAQDEIVSLAGYVRSLMDKEVPREHRPNVGSNSGTEAAATMVFPQRESKRPICYGNHITAYKKCLVCPWEQACESESDPQVSKELRLQEHERLAAA